MDHWGEPRLTQNAIRVNYRDSRQHQPAANSSSFADASSHRFEVPRGNLLPAPRSFDARNQRAQTSDSNWGAPRVARNGIRVNVQEPRQRRTPRSAARTQTSAGSDSRPLTLAEVYGTGTVEHVREARKAHSRSAKQTASRSQRRERDQLMPIVENGQVQERIATITLIGTSEAHSHEGGVYVRKDDDHSSEDTRVYRFRTEAEYRYKLRQVVAKFKHESARVDTYTSVKWTDMFIVDSLPGDQMEEDATPEDEMGIQRCDWVIDNRFLKKGVDPNQMSESDKEKYLNCLLKPFIQTYARNGSNPRGLVCLTLERGGVKLCCDIMGLTPMQVATDGIRIRQFQKLCDHFKIGLLALDHTFNFVIPRTVHHPSSYKAFCCYVFDGHAYPVVDRDVKSTLSHSYVEKGEGTSSQHINQEATKDQVQIAATQAAHFLQEVRMKPTQIVTDIWDVEQLDKLENCNVYYHQPNLKIMVDKLLMEKKTLYVHRFVENRVMCIDYDNGVKLLANSNHRSHMDWNDSMLAAKLAGVPYRNQSVSMVGEDHFQMSFHPAGAKVKRVPPSKSLRARILKEQQFKCNMCNQKMRKQDAEINHIIPVCNGGRTVRSNLEGLCKKCHKEVSDKQAAERVVNIDNSLSYYNDQTLPIFTKVKNAICHNFFNMEQLKQMHDRGYKHFWGLDLRKCRRNALRYANKEDWCVVSCLDSPVKFKQDEHGTLPRGFYFIVSNNVCPLKGNGWYSKPMVQYCLRNKVIQWDQIKCVLKASMRLEPQYFHRWIDDLLRRFSQGDDYDIGKKDALLKLMINGVVGMMGSRNTTHRYMRCFTVKEAANAEVLKRAAKQKDTLFTVVPKHFRQCAEVDWCTCKYSSAADHCFCSGKCVCKKRQAPMARGELCNFCNFNERYSDETGSKPDGDPDKPDYYEAHWRIEKQRMESHMPIFMQILDLEAIECHKIIRQMEKHGGKAVHVNTDCVVGVFKSKRQTDQCWAVAENAEWERGVPKYKAETHINPSRIESMEEPCTDLYELKTPIWRNFNDPGHDDFALHAKRVLNQMKGFNLLGYAGCGKTHLLHSIMDELKSREIPFLAVAPTHQAKKILHADAKTILAAFSGLKRGGGYSRFAKYAYFIVDECSMITEPVWLLCIRLKQRLEEMGVETRWVVSGDFTQLPPVCCRLGEGFNYKDSYGLHWLCDGNRVHLWENRRSKVRNHAGELVPSRDSQKLFELYMNPQTVDVEQFPRELHDLSVCYTNSMRKRINAFWMQRYANQMENYLIVPKPAVGHQHYQDLWLYDGLPLIARKTRSALNICNADRLQVVRYNQKSVYLRHALEDGTLGDEIIRIPTVEISGLCMPGFCLTLHTAQGCSWGRPYTILQWNRMDDTMKYVAMSRSRKLEYINIAEDEPSGDVIDPDELSGDDDVDWSEFYEQDDEADMEEELVEAKQAFSETNNIDVDDIDDMQFAADNRANINSIDD